jgi:hypothetical protein
MTPIAQRFWPKVNKDGPVIRPELGPCWEWTAATRGNGYGIIGIGGREGGSGYAHRVSYELNVGAIPDRMMVRHRCDNRRCVRPEHLAVGLAVDNTADMLERKRGRHSNKDTCPYGHPYDAIRPSGARRCRECTRRSQRAYKARLRAS